MISCLPGLNCGQKTDNRAHSAGMPRTGAKEEVYVAKVDFGADKTLWKEGQLEEDDILHFWCWHDSLDGKLKIATDNIFICIFC